MRLKTRISKKQLGILFGIADKEGRVNSYELRNGFFTDEVLKLLGISSDEFNKIRKFTYKQSLQIIDIFEIEKEDIESLV